MSKNYVSWLMRNYRITFFIVIIFFILGIIGLDQMAKPLERYLFTYDEVKREKTTTTSSNGMCVAMVELQDEVNTIGVTVVFGIYQTCRLSKKSGLI